VKDESRADADERSHEIKAQQVSLNHFLTSPLQDRASLEHDEFPKGDPWPYRNVQQIIHHDAERDYQRLRDLESIDASEDIDAIRRESAEERHIGVIHPTEIDSVTQVGTDWFRHNNGCQAGFGIVDEEEWDGGDEWDWEFVAPPDVEYVVEEAEHGCGEEGKDGGEVESELEGGQLMVLKL
jgi:hypothetical protein